MSAQDLLATAQRVVEQTPVPDGIHIQARLQPIAPTLGAEPFAAISIHASARFQGQQYEQYGYTSVEGAEGLSDVWPDVVRSQIVSFAAEVLRRLADVVVQ